MFAYFNSFTIEMTLAQAQGASHQGRCDEDVEALRQTPKIKRQLKRISDAALVSELKETGAWSPEELQDREENERRIIWIAAGNIVEEKHYRDTLRS